MRAHHRMINARRCHRIILWCHTLASVTAAVICRVVFYGEPAESPLERFRDLFIGAVHVTEMRVTTRRGNLDRIQYAGLRRLRHIRHVRMPGGFACAEASDGNAI